MQYYFFWTVLANIIIIIIIIDFNDMLTSQELFYAWFGLVWLHINHCRLFNAKSNLNSSISNNSV